eukprot:CAMPEP_0198137674 /NCGR_PEP_ID=MMETSP1443-20131203/1144_1 /TAXON_ID=186043 /ORGANISM="Entomoneis sp., Strain CCMP2396" /LENGTH=304 /DNA_ID=CAMNT_0043799183 /DNA_START=15 /DNA_END=929 /DNA_ORIENTATION=+
MAIVNNNEYKSVFRPNLFQGRVALVTGGGTGIGRTIATELASLGCTVIIASRKAEICQEAAQEINAALKCGNCVIPGPATNIRDEDEVAALIEFCLAQTKSRALHYVVNNAGGQFISPAENLSKGGFGAVVETNLVGTFLVCKQAYLQYMQSHDAHKAGFSCSIANITLGNRNGMPYMSHSGAARAGVENLTATLCTEWIESGVRLNCVRPGIIWTESGFAAYGEAGTEYAAKILPSIPAKRFGTPEEVGSAVVWLLSDAASYVTGATLCVDGGGSYTYLPLVETPDETHLPTYGAKLPTQARL